MIASPSPGIESVAASPTSSHELLEVRAGEVADVEPSEHGVREPERAHAEPVATRRGDVLDEPDARERAELARDRARADPRPPGEVGRPELAAVGERVEDLDGADRRFDVSGGGLTGTGHRASLLPLSSTLLRLAQ